MKSRTARPMQSRKFRAFLLSEFTWKLTLAVVILLNQAAMSPGFFGICMAIILVSGFLEVVYIGSQEALDRYVKVAALAVGGKVDGLPPTATPTPSEEDDDQPSL